MECNGARKISLDNPSIYEILKIRLFMNSRTADSLTINEHLILGKEVKKMFLSSSERYKIIKYRLEQDQAAEEKQDLKYLFELKSD